MAAAEEKAGLPHCPRCARALPPGQAKVCVYCGTFLGVTPARPAHPAPPAPRPGRDPQVGAVVAGRFRIEELIGQGGMGKVYRARHLALDRVVCLKMLKTALLQDPTLVGRFEREAKAASRLNHPNGISVLDFGRNDADGGLFIAMEYVQGKDLKTMLRDDWPLPEERLCNIMAQVLAALGEAHAHNVIHRDLKPENIMVERRRDQTDFVKVLDFGIAKILDSDLPGLTRSDVVCGTPQYMAPEQATGGQLDGRCDLYAIGVILYQMTTGHLPFDGQNSMEVLTRHVNELPVPPRRRRPDAGISEAMESLILRALEKDPALRPQSAEEFRRLILEAPKRKPAAALHSRGLLKTPSHATTLPSARPSDPARPASRSAARPPRFLAAAAGATLVLLLAGGALMRARSEKQAAAPATGGPVAVATPVGTGAASSPVPVQRDPVRAKELVLRATEWQAANDTGAARDLLEQAVQLDPDNAEAHYRLGGLFLNSQPARARAEYQAASRLDAPRYRDVVDTILEKL